VLLGKAGQNPATSENEARGQWIFHLGLVILLWHENFMEIYARTSLEPPLAPKGCRVLSSNNFYKM
jgi:hypothetical protein